MNKRIEFNKKGEEILSFLESYGVLKYEHFEKFFPGSKKIISYLIKNQRIYECADKVYVSTERDFRTDKCLIATMSVLADIFEKVQSHTRATAPAQISFYTYSGDYYEIVYVGYGMEAMISASFEMQLTARQPPIDNAGKAKRIAIIEDKSQMTRLQIPGIVRFVLIQPDGSLSYFKGS